MLILWLCGEKFIFLGIYTLKCLWIKYYDSEVCFEIIWDGEVDESTDDARQSIN